MTTKIIVIDFGHGGSDPGAIGNGINESVAAELTGYRIKKYLEENYDVQIYLTRSNNQTYPTLAERPQLAKDVGADAFISVHYNKFDGTAYGFESIRQLNTDTTSIDYALQEEIHTKVVNAILPLGGRDRGMKTQDLQVLRDLQGSGIAGVLIEGLFIDHNGDMELFMSADYMDAYTKAVADGIAAYVQAGPKVAPETIVTTTIDFAGKAKGDGDLSRTIKYTGIQQSLTAPNNVVTEVGGGYAGVGTVDNGTMYYEVTTVGNVVQFDFIFNLDNIATRDVLVNDLRQIKFSEKVANNSGVARNAEHKVYAYNVAQGAWTDEVAKLDTTVGGYVDLVLTANFADYLDAANNIQFAVVSAEAADSNPIRVEIDYASLTVDKVQ